MEEEQFKYLEFPAQGTPTPEERLLWDIFGSQEQEEQVSENLDVQQFTRKSFPVEAVRVTEANMEEVAKWCDGEIRLAEESEKPVANIGDRYIKVRVQNPLTERQTKAFLGDWVLYAGKGYKVYTDKAFRKSFDGMINKPDTKNVFEEVHAASVAASSRSAINPGGTRSV